MLDHLGGEEDAHALIPHACSRREEQGRLHNAGDKILEWRFALP